MKFTHFLIVLVLAFLAVGLTGCTTGTPEGITKEAVAKEALANEDTATCDKITNESLRYSCYIDLAESRFNPSICEKINDSNRSDGYFSMRDLCFEGIISKVSMCSREMNPGLMFSSKSEALAFCEKIQNKVIKNNCLATAKSMNQMIVGSVYAFPNSGLSDIDKIVITLLLKEYPCAGLDQLDFRNVTVRIGNSQKVSSLKYSPEILSNDKFAVEGGGPSIDQGAFSKENPVIDDKFSAELTVFPEYSKVNMPPGTKIKIELISDWETITIEETTPTNYDVQYGRFSLFDRYKYLE